MPILYILHGADAAALGERAQWHVDFCRINTLHSKSVFFIRTAALPCFKEELLDPHKSCVISCIDAQFQVAEWGGRGYPRRGLGRHCAA